MDVDSASIIINVEYYCNKASLQAHWRFRCGIDLALTVARVDGLGGFKFTERLGIA
jgi:hypothetical protein